jgi:uncharacterized iron-regulated protein
MPAILLLLASLAAAPADTVTAGHYRVYDGEGNPSSIEAIVEAMAAADVLFIGETHDDPVVHHLQRELLERAFTTLHQRGVVLSMEMFAQDAQRVVDEYLAGLITESHFTGASSPWINYGTDYRPLVEFARIHSIQVVAANAPRRYVNRVTRLGPESLYDLPDYTREFMAPLPYAPASDRYRAEWDALMAESMAEMQAAVDSAAESGEEPQPAMPAMPAMAPAAPDSLPPGHPRPEPADSAAAAPPAGPDHGSMAFMLDAQSLWDATMAWSVAEALLAKPGSLVLHVVGAFHVENGTGIPEHLARYRPGVRQVVVTVRPAADVEAFDSEEHGGLGDFVILADEALPRTHKR